MDCQKQQQSGEKCSPRAQLHNWLHVPQDWLYNQRNGLDHRDLMLWRLDGHEVTEQPHSYGLLHVHGLIDDLNGFSRNVFNGFSRNV